MTQFQTQPTPADIQAAVGRTLTDLGAAFSGVLVNIGRRLGLYKAMVAIGACTPEQLAEATGIRERYVREWLNNQAAGGYVRYEPEGRTYSLPAAQAMVLAVEDSPVYMAPAFEVAAAFWLDEERILEAFRSGEGLGWHEHHERLFCGTEMFFRTGYSTHLVSDWLPALDGVSERLRGGARVADVGCGHGASTIIMARAFPKSEFVGVDYHPDSITTARRRALEAGVDNARFEIATAKD
jgi:2-polyprenyl-3-methyl-5-hydroxy-6-metoxy-1,4-benzoquinol methylase